MTNISQLQHTPPFCINNVRLQNILPLLVQSWLKKNGCYRQGNF